MIRRYAGLPRKSLTGLRSSIAAGRLASPAMSAAVAVVTISAALTLTPAQATQIGVFHSTPAAAVHDNLGGGLNPHLDRALGPDMSPASADCYRRNYHVLEKRDSGRSTDAIASEVRRRCGI